MGTSCEPCAPHKSIAFAAPRRSQGKAKARRARHSARPPGSGAVAASVSRAPQQSELGSSLNAHPGPLSDGTAYTACRTSHLLFRGRRIRAQSWTDAHARSLPILGNTDTDQGKANIGPHSVDKCWADCCRRGPNSTRCDRPPQFDKCWAELGPTSVELGQHRAKHRWCWANLGQTQPNLHPIRPKSPSLGRISKKSTNCGHAPTLGQLRLGHGLNSAGDGLNSAVGTCAAIKRHASGM